MTIPEALQAAIAHQQAGRLPEAEKAFREVLSQDPRNQYALNFLGLVLHLRGQHEEGIRLMRQSIASQPPMAHLYSNLAGVLLTVGDAPGAEAASKSAIERDPNSAQAHLDLGQAVWRQGRFEEALEHLKRSLEIDSTRYDTHSALGLCLLDAGKLDDAIAELQKAVEMEPSHAINHANLGTALLAAHRADEAIEHYRHAIEKVPYEPMFHVSLGLALLAGGQWEEGWTEYEWRLQIPSFNPVPRIYVQPRWDGSSPQGKTLLLYHEEGMNDAVMFARFIPFVARYGAQVIFEVRPELVQLMKNLKGAKIVARGQPLPQFDIHCSLLSLPKRLKTTRESIPSEVPYLNAPDVRAQQLKERIQTNAGDAKLRVGISLPQPGVGADRDRAPQLKTLAPLGEVNAVRWYNLGPTTAAGQTVGGAELVDLPPSFRDFADVAAAIANLDLVISADTVVAHIAGALGKDVWTLLPYSADWRWMEDSSETPWYPTMRLFRQPAPHDWATVAAKVTDALREKVPK